MLRMGGTASPSHIAVFEGIKAYFQRRDIDLDWILYSGYDPLVEGFVSGEVDLAWNGPLSYVKIKRRTPCRVVAMREVDVGYVTQFVTREESPLSTPQDLLGKRFAFGRRDSVETGLLAHHFLKEAGIDPRRDLETASFQDQRQPASNPGEWDVLQRVASGEYHAGAVSKRTLEVLGEQGTPVEGDLRAFWSSPGYSHCCFTAQAGMDPELAKKITDAFVSMDPADPTAKGVLEGEACNSFVPGITHGREAVELAAEEEGLI